MELGVPAYPTIYLGRNEPLEFVWEGMHGVYALAQGDNQLSRARRSPFAAFSINMCTRVMKHRGRRFASEHPAVQAGTA